MQVWLVLLFWLSRFYLSPSRGPRVLWLRRLNRLLARKYTPWQIILATCTLFYAVRHGDVLLGLQAPEPLARLYSSDFYRSVRPFPSRPSRGHRSRRSTHADAIIR